MIQALFIHDFLPGRPSAVGAFPNKDTDSNSQEIRIGQITQPSEHFIADISVTVHLTYIHRFSTCNFNSYLAIIMVKNHLT